MYLQVAHVEVLALSKISLNHAVTKLMQLKKLKKNLDYIDWGVNNANNN